MGGKSFNEFVKHHPELGDVARQNQPEAFEHMLHTPVPYMQVFQDTYARLHREDRSSSDAALERAAHASAGQSEKDRLGFLVKEQTGAAVALKNLMDIADQYRASGAYYPKESQVDFLGKSIAFDMPNPGDLVDLVAATEKDPPDLIVARHKQWRQEYGVQTTNRLVYVDMKNRMASYDRLFPILYGDRWSEYRKLTGFTSFEDWRADITLAHPNLEEELSIMAAKSVLKKMGSD